MKMTQHLCIDCNVHGYIIDRSYAYCERSYTLQRFLMYEYANVRCECITVHARLSRSARNIFFPPYVQKSLDYNRQVHYK